MSEPNKDGTDIMMALLMGLSGPRASRAWNESQQIKAESFLTMAEHWINQTAEENARLKAEVERLTKAGDSLYKSMLEIGCNEMADNFQYDAWRDSMKDWNAAKEGKQS
jgi:Tfp pilus assembly protein PilX